MPQSLLPVKAAIANGNLESNPSPSPEYAEVAVPLRVKHTYTYRLPVAYRQNARVGARVIVQFGRQQVTGYIVDLRESFETKSGLTDADIKPVIDLLDDEPLLIPEILTIVQWVADYYAAPWGEVLKAALPAGLNVAHEKVFRITTLGHDELERMIEKGKTNLTCRVLQLIAEAEKVSMRLIEQQVTTRQASRIVNELEKAGYIAHEHTKRQETARTKQRKSVRLLPPESRDGSLQLRTLTINQKRTLDTLANAGGTISLAELLTGASVSASTVRTLEKAKLLEVFTVDVRRDPFGGEAFPVPIDFELNEEQTRSLTEIEAAIAAGSYAAFLLHGITGSGKTEIYIRAMRATLARGKTAMMLVPEIALTPVFSRRLRACFGDQVAIFHSSLSVGERYDEWGRLKRGEARIVIGTRSAVFAPVSNLGLVVVDEEHETSYRQHESPYYHGRDTAIVRARMESAVVLLGSATPSIESYHNAHIGKYRYLHLPRRIGNRTLATATLVDMRKVFAVHQRSEVFSAELLAEIEATHARGEQSIILLNRRGFSSFVLCRSCGESIHCPNCDVTLTFHRGASALVCHYCNHRQRTPMVCPTCSGKYIHYVGEGTEQIEDLLRNRFPTLRIARLDRDTTSRRKLYEKVISEFSVGELDMLVGTQMLAKGHDFPNVTLVGVVSVDAGLSLPDFRSAERTFQLITQVAGRAGRGTRAGRVLIQTYHPDHYALRHACEQDYEGFYAEEMRYRKSLNYPPFVVLASLLVRGKDARTVLTTAAEMRTALDKANSNRECRVLGPAPAPIARLKGEYRRQILVKAHSRARLRDTIDKAIVAATERGCDAQMINLEIDPVDLM